jgi:hypothetical protein
LDQIQECWDGNFQAIHGSVENVLLDGVEEASIGGDVFKDARYEELFVCLFMVVCLFVGVSNEE